ncbi:MAG: TCP-1/cpn60 chaperonin family protein [Candidatus Bathyarchaeia archaeon]
MDLQAAPATGGQQPILIWGNLSESSRSETWLQNISAVAREAEIVWIFLHPNSIERVASSFSDVAVTNEGVTALSETDLQHHAVKTVLQTLQTKKNEDGITSMTILASETSLKAKELLKQNTSQTLVIDGFVKTWEQAIRQLEKTSLIGLKNRRILSGISETSVGGETITNREEELSRTVADAIPSIEKEKCGSEVELNDVNVQKTWKPVPRHPIVKRIHS